MKLLAYPLLLILVLLSGCAPSIQMSKVDREATNSIAINDQVSMPQGMYYYGPWQQVAMLFGPVGGVIAGKTAQKPAEQISQFARDNNIFIEEIVKNEFISQFQNNGKFKIKNSYEADANLDINVLMYGLTIPNGFSKKLVPLLKINAKITNLDGKTIWENSDYIFGSEFPGYTLEEIKENPHLLKESWMAATKKSVAIIINAL